jgi:hypothetical protein
MPERNPAAFAGVGSGPTHELACVSELVEIRIVRWLAGGRSKNDGESVIRTISSRVGFWIAGKPIVRLNRYAYRHR